MSFILNLVSLVPYSTVFYMCEEVLGILNLGFGVEFLGKEMNIQFGVTVSRLMPERGL